MVRACLQHPLRVMVRGLRLGRGLWSSAREYHRLRRGRGGELTLAERAAWLQRCARRVAAALNLHCTPQGPVPGQGLVVSNHLGYLDIVVLAALHPVVFVSKDDVRRWPVFGWFAARGGTLFVRREKRTDVGRLADELHALLAEGATLVLFPEGTSSGGETVLPFKSALLEPVIQQQRPVVPAAIDYRLADGDVVEEVCYWKDMTLVPHLINLLGKERIDAWVVFGEPRACGADRKQVARELQAEVGRLKGQLACRAGKEGGCAS